MEDALVWSETKETVLARRINWLALDLDTLGYSLRVTALGAEALDDSGVAVKSWSSDEILRGSAQL